MNLLKFIIVSVLLSVNIISYSQDDNTPPSIPENLTYHDITAASVRLTWSASTDEGGLVVGYIIFRGNDSLTSVNGLEYTAAGLTDGTIYSFTIASYDTAGNQSGKSTSVNFRTLDITKPSAPTLLIAHDTTSSSVRLTWSGSTDNVAVTGYIIYRGTDSIGNIAHPNTEYTVSGLTASTSYSFHVNAYDAANNRSDTSNHVIIKTLAPADIIPPVKPTGLIAHDTTTTSVSLTWNATTDNIAVSGYVVYRGTDSVTTVNALTYIVTGLTPSTIYSFSIIAKDAAGNKSIASDPVSVKTLAPPDIISPSAPTNLIPHDITMLSVRLTWSQSTDNVGVTGYIVYRGVDSIAQVTGLEYIVNNLTPATRYIFTVKAKDAAGNKSLSSNAVDTLTAKDNVVPSAPAGLAASDTTTTSVRLSWNASTDNVGVIGYVVYRGVDSITTVAATQYIVTGLTPSTTYSFSVRAKDAAGNKSVSGTAINVKTKATPDIINPTSPGNLSASNITVTSVRISWSASTDNVGVTGYILYKGSDSLTTVNALEYTFTGLIPATSYTFSIRARDAAGNKSSASAIGIITAYDILSPTAPGNFTGRDITISSVRLTWTASTDNVGVIGYIVYRGSDSISTVTGLECLVGGLTLGTSYSFSVRAIDATWNKSSASTISIVTSSDVTPPSTPTNLTGSDFTSYSVHLAWNASTDNVGVTGYFIYWGTDSLAVGMNTEYTVTGLKPATNYSFTIKARDAGGNRSLPSNSLNIKTLDLPDTQPPSSPSGLGAMNTTDTSVYIYWNASTDNLAVTGYILYMGSDSIASTNYLGYNVKGLSPSTRYWFSVKAIDGAGNISLSSITINIKTHIASDNEMPSAPANLVAFDTGSTSVHLSWTASTDNNKVTGYRIYVDDSIYATTPNPDYILTGLLPESIYSIYVRAYDAVANLSMSSDIIEITTLHQADETPPSVPSGLTVYNLSTEQICFRWDPSTDNEELLGYQIFVNGELITLTTLTEFSLVDLIPETVYTFYIRAIDTAGNISGPSIRVSVSTSGIIGISQRNQTNFSIYVFAIGNKNIYVKIPANLEKTESVEIYNISGKLMRSSNSLEGLKVIDSDFFARGVYVLVISGHTSQYSTRFIY